MNQLIKKSGESHETIAIPFPYGQPSTLAEQVSIYLM